MKLSGTVRIWLDYQRRVWEPGWNTQLKYSVNPLTDVCINKKNISRITVTPSLYGRTHSSVSDSKRDSKGLQVSLGKEGKPSTVYG